MPNSPDSRVRHRVLAMATVVAFLMYLDRICLANILTSDSFKAQVRLEGWQLDWIKGAFFWAYALFQVPAGWLSDRFGARVLITIYIAAWSIFTAATSLATGFVGLMLARLLCGLAEAGYYPAGSGMMTRWAHGSARGFSSSLISWGGRVGGATAPLLTAWLILAFGDWRAAGWIYGGFGLAVAAAFWLVFRDHPRQHPGCSEAEIRLLAEGRGEFLPTREPPRRFPWADAMSSGNLWLANSVQFFTNIGWAFLILSLPDYLREVIGLSERDSGMVSTVALTIGILSLPLGGLCTDWICRRHGRRMGRMLPMALSKFVAAALYLLALQLKSPVALAVVFGLVAFWADLGLPAMWTTMQDISGKHQAQLFGWGNMWGNLGAAIMPLLFNKVLVVYDHNQDRHEGVWLCAAAFVLAGLCALAVDATKPVSREPGAAA